MLKKYQLIILFQFFGKSVFILGQCDPDQNKTHNQTDTQQTAIHLI